ncbi:acetate--CoA ligase family protein [Roseibacterium sp. SDUM158016]|uniref:acetate--CoA ligase family protein n=1 Tax=Roseicyclus sediminis TaxID=2980997 RepID=UPI0021D01816|nr:acetate--CoA ligase family protein [Roseibacterium sp. SDUM158016]MCU4655002.1 acetate--CoA ligase family protein [Roseibacterium sp. SDUM158016]
MSGCNSVVPNIRALLEPRSIAVFGASGRSGRPGHDVIAALDTFGASPDVYPVTPRYETILGRACLSAPKDLPSGIDLAVIASGSARIISDAEAAIAAGVGALHVLGDLGPDDCDRLGAMARAAGIPLLGPNSVGYVNYAGRQLSTWIAPPDGHREAGSIALIVQSGALFSYANSVDPRLRFSLTLQPGREAGLTLADAMDHALDMPQTAVLGLYLETVSAPERFVAMLARADAAGVPVVVLAPGRSPAAAEAIATHARRLAGTGAGLEAAFRRFGVTQVSTLDAFWTTLHLFSAIPVPGPGGLAILTDSGAQRAMTIDICAQLGVPLARFAEPTRARLRGVLDSELSVDNPLDIWGGEKDLAAHTATCLETAVSDPGTAMAVIVTEFGVPDSDTFPTRMAEGASRVAGTAGKPVVAASFSTRHFASGRMREMEARGLPVLDGLETSLLAIRDLFARRDRTHFPASEPLGSPLGVALAERVADLSPADEAGALALLSAVGIPVVPHRVVESADAAQSAARELGGRVVLKTAAPLLHKTEVGGVHLDLGSPGDIAAAWDDLANRLGPRVLVARMERTGHDLALGAIVDPQFGPLVMVGAGGIEAELLADRRFALAPVSETEALSMIAGLAIAPRLSAFRGGPAADVASAARAVVALSRLIAACSARISEIDINPLRVGLGGVVALDAVIIKTQENDEDPSQ